MSDCFWGFNFRTLGSLDDTLGLYLMAYLNTRYICQVFMDKKTHVIRKNWNPTEITAHMVHVGVPVIILILYSIS